MGAFLIGTRQGIFDLEWSIRCPSCFGPADVQEELAALKNHAHCAGCRVDIDNAALDSEVEVCFKVGGSVRPDEPPHFTEIIKAWVTFDFLQKKEVAPGSKWVYDADIPAGPYKVFTDGFRARAAFLVEAAAKTPDKEIRFDLKENGLEWHAGARAPGRYAIRFRNSTASPVNFNFARALEAPWVSGLDVASNQLFRDMFSGELISADASFSVKNIVLLFTDIRGSTDLYERRGDARAYALVKEHFRILFESVRRHNGAVVKTIGDAVMASFLTPTDAMAAIFDAHDRFEIFNERSSENPIVIKAGVHGGACLAVTLNDALDYFGRMVNLAARIQGESRGGDIVVSRTLHGSAGVGKMASDLGWSASVKTAGLKGIEDEVGLVVLTRGR
ncbi:MAG: adenylate/guanylate cyclase domain-containing protein [Elusimicrobia bacterium]|nr:adenylate/guanylate cyclase domain-containing protein [Elusimicrobiota bacterium]